MPAVGRWRQEDRELMFNTENSGDLVFQDQEEREIEERQREACIHTLPVSLHIVH